MNPSSSSPSTSSSSKRKRDQTSLDEPICKYDVFVSYSKEDIGKGFISHLHGALHRKGFTISDHTKLPVGLEVGSELLKAIVGSQIFVLVFSPKYASSVRCLDELVDIMDCRDKYDRKTVFPVFFTVDPHDVRKQSGPFKEAFETHTANFDDHRVQKWRQALEKAGQLVGEPYNQGDQESFICKIVKKLQRMQNPQELLVANHPTVGIDSRVEELESILRLQSNDVFIVAVLGISGIGKTTIVRALYNKIAQEFDASCFLEVTELCKGPNKKHALQNELISCLSQDDEYRMMYNHNLGDTKIRKLISHQKVLVVIDDVDDHDQLEALAINPKFFQGGSRIVATTRNKRSLGSLPYVSYHTRQLSTTESVELLIRLMYEEDDPLIDMDLLSKTAYCASGFPLVLVLWSRHFSFHEKREWPEVLKLIQAIPRDDVHEKLKITYDALRETTKKLFLDIVFFFDGMYKDLIVQVLEEKHAQTAFFWRNEIQCLADRGLVIIKSGVHSRVLMQHAIREMGKEIVRQENIKEPGQRTRLITHRDVRHVLEESTGTELVESICQGQMTVPIDALGKMKNLRLIRLKEINILGCDSEGMPVLFFPHLKYLEWQCFPMESINIEMPNVVVVLLRKSKLKTLWKEPKSMEKMKILDVSESQYLTTTGSFKDVKNLKYLHLNDCENLKELDSSVGLLDKLVTLNFNAYFELERFRSKLMGKFEQDEVIKPFVSSLKETRICTFPSEVGSLSWLNHLDLGGNYFHSLPDSFGKLDRLETINLSYCYYLQSIPDLPRSICSVKASDCHSLTILPSNMSELTSLRKLDLHSCKCLATLPSCMSGLTSLKELDVSDCFKLGTEDPEYLMKITGLTNLTVLNMENCNVSQIPNEIRNLVSLQRLDISRNPFSSLPDGFSNLLQLRDLSIRDCDQLTSLPLLPPLLTMIKATGCFSLDVMRSASVVIDNFSRCPTPSINYVYEFSQCVNAAYKEASFLSRLRINLSKGDVPNWCYYIGTQQGESFMAPQHLNRKIYGMILCVSARNSSIYRFVNLQNQTKGTSYRLTSEWILNMMCVMFVPLDNSTLMVEAGDEFVVNIQTIDGTYFSGYGLCLIYKGEDEGDEMEPTTNHVNQTTRPNGIQNVRDDALYNTLIVTHNFYNCFDTYKDPNSDEDYTPSFQPYHV